MLTKKISGELEVDVERGVVYFHSPVGATVLRICGLKIPKKFGNSATDSIDITLKYLDKHPVMYNVWGNR
ncbi:MAG: hypothetical protein HQK96_06965 [Nitrospirae bacterium]|nr:hypothetical protein [Nitrospirota bacterium]